MSVAFVSGSAGLIGSEAVRHFAGLGLRVVGIDNDLRRYFFGEDGSTAWSLLRLTSELGDDYTHFDVQVRLNVRGIKNEGNEMEQLATALETILGRLRGAGA